MDKRIVRASIHPGIGIARVGDSQDEFFIGPEVRFPAPAPPGFYKDATGALKRQAARFRLFGLDEDGQVVAELNASNADITWTVHVANRKAAWYNFERAMDIPEAITQPSFTEHIDPLLRQFSDGQWVNYGFHVQFGWGGPQNFLRSAYVRKLATITKDSSGKVTDIYKPLRRQVLHLFRAPSTTDSDPSKWPQVYGDAMDVPQSPRANLTLTNTQYNFLVDWANGNFIDDWTGVDRPPIDLESLPVAERSMHLDRAALWFCLGGPFHPGCEMTWPMRTTTLYSAPFRIRPRAPGQPMPDYGDVLTPDVATSPFGPLFSHGPGDVTRWLAVPWQADSASCRAGYTPEYDPYLPTFWPARVPNHVLSEADYVTLMNRSLPDEVRHEAFDTRSNWPRWLAGVGLDQTNQMIKDFGKMGVLERRDGPGDSDAFPPELYVELQVGFRHRPHFQQNLTNGPKEKLLRHARRDKSWT